MVPKRKTKKRKIQFKHKDTDMYLKGKVMSCKIYFNMCCDYVKKSILGCTLLQDKKHSKFWVKVIKMYQP
jgi:hypothetical protein